MPKEATSNSLECYLIPSVPLPLILPVECVADIIQKPEIEVLGAGSANWMVGHFTWQNQRLPVMSYAGLHDPTLNESRKRKANLVVLNPVPNAARKAYSALLCFGDIKTITVDSSAVLSPPPEAIDKRYVDAVVESEGMLFIVPKLAAISVAFSYF